MIVKRELKIHSKRWAWYFTYWIFGSIGIYIPWVIFFLSQNHSDVIDLPLIIMNVIGVTFILYPIFLIWKRNKPDTIGICENCGREYKYKKYWSYHKSSKVAESHFHTCNQFTSSGGLSNYHDSPIVEIHQKKDNREKFCKECRIKTNSHIEEPIKLER